METSRYRRLAEIRYEKERSKKTEKSARLAKWHLDNPFLAGWKVPVRGPRSICCWQKFRRVVILDRYRRVSGNSVRI